MVYSEEVKDIMSEISETIETGGSGDNEYGAKPLDTHLDTIETTDPQLFPRSPQVRFGHGGAAPYSPTNVKGSLSIAENDLNPPEIQKAIVEHIVRRDELNTHSHFPIKLRSFSGKTLRPNSETNYDTWHSHVELLRKDPTMSNLQKSRKIFETCSHLHQILLKRISNYWMQL